MVVLAALPALAQVTASPVCEDPPLDAAHPARFEVAHIPSHGLRLNALMYVAAGAGLHPTGAVVNETTRLSCGLTNEP